MLAVYILLTTDQPTRIRLALVGFAATLATMIVYLICCLATIKLQRMNVRTEGAIPFRVPGGPVIPVLASLVVVWLMTSSTRQEFLAIAAMLVVETLLYLLMKSRLGPVPVAVDS